MPIVEHKGKKYIVLPGEPHEEVYIIPLEKVDEDAWEKWVKTGPQEPEAML